MSTPELNTSPLLPIQQLEAICREIFERWDKDQRPGKLLQALGGGLSNYRQDVEDVRRALSPTTDSVLAQGQPLGKPSVEHLQELLRQRDVDISNLISELRALEGATGGSLEDEDAALVAHIEKDLRTREEIRDAIGAASPPSGAPGVREALEPFAWIGQWMFARDLPDETPVVNVEHLGKPFALTRGHFKAASKALAALDESVPPHDSAAKLDANLVETLTDNVAYIRSIRDAAFEECAQIALAIDSNRGNEKEIAKAIINRKGLPPLAQSQEASGHHLIVTPSRLVLDIDEVLGNENNTTAEELTAIADAILAKYDLRAKR